MSSERQVYVLYSVEFSSRILLPKVFGQCTAVATASCRPEALLRPPPQPWLQPQWRPEACCVLHQSRGYCLNAMAT